MSKAILILDEMPSSCAKCKVVDYWSRPQEYHCRYLDDRYIKKYNEKPIDCPLKPLPEKKQMFYGTSYDIIENRGFNACLDEILGEK